MSAETEQGSRRELQAIVLSGCGCSSPATYGVGVMKALIKGGLAHLDDAVPFDPDIYSGSGFGAFNAAVMASQAGGSTAAALGYLEEAWLEGICSTATRANGVYRLRANPLTFFDSSAYQTGFVGPLANMIKDLAFLSSDLAGRVRANFGPDASGSLLKRLLSMPAMTPLFDMTPLQEQLKKYVDLDRIRNSSKELMVVASDWERGMPCIFRRPDMTDDVGHKALQASAAFTLAFPFVEINGRPFMGAPGTMATPLNPVIDTYAPKASRLTVHVVYLDPLMKDIPIDKPDNALGGLGRWFTLNESVNISAEPEYASGPVPKSKPATDTPVVIHRYRPKKIIVDWFNTFGFDAEMTRDFIEQGYRETRVHNCDAEGCTLAPQGVTSPVSTPHAGIAASC